MIYFAIMLVLQVTSESTALPVDPWEAVPLTNLSEIDLPPAAIPGEWIVSAGLQVDDLSDIEGMPTGLREIVDPLATQMLPMGVRSVADYSLAKEKFPFNIITVRVFVFDSPAECRNWWRKKYEGDGWEKHYKRLDYPGAVAVQILENESEIQVNKVALAFGKVWLTTHQLREGNEHLVAANHILRALTGGVRQFPLPGETSDGSE